MRIIPAIDIIGGKCVRLTKGDYTTKKIYNENPLEVAKRFEASGIEYLHLVDLDGAKAKHIINYKVLEQDLLNGGNSKLILSAMITNFQTRIDLLQDVLDQVENIKNLKNYNDENYTI